MGFPDCLLYTFRFVPETGDLRGLTQRFHNGSTVQITTSSRATFLWRIIRQWKYRIVLALAGLSFVSLTSLLYPWLLKLMVDRFAGHGSTDLSTDLLTTILIGVFLASAVAGHFEQVEMRRLGFRLRNTLRTALYDSLLAKPMSFHRSARVGELSSRATEDIGLFQTLFPGLLAPAVQNALFISGCLILMVTLNWIATVLVVLLVILPIPLFLILSRSIRRYAVESHTDQAEANAFFEESLVAVREIKAFVREKWELQRYARLLDRAYRSEVNGSILQVKMNQVVYMLVSAALLAVFYTGTRRSFLPDWTVGDVIAFYFYSYTMTMAVLSVGKIYLSYQEITGALERVMELLREDGTETTHRAVSGAVDRIGNIEFRDVTFSYDHMRNVLEDASFSVDHGEWQIITGPSGGGKSTLANLIMGFYRADSGSIRVSGVPIERWDKKSLRSQIGYVGQDPVLFHGTLRDNITFACSGGPSDGLSRAIEQSCLDDLVDSLPDGLDTLIGERGYTLSGGQKSRVAIARAIILDPPLLILDEANAMLESELEIRLWNNLAGIRGSKTTIIISHHCENIPRREHALELRDGRISSGSMREEMTALTRG
jgi:ABC-type multidrug transport system fused ATPase/permease subunit